MVGGERERDVDLLGFASISRFHLRLLHCTCIKVSPNLCLPSSALLVSLFFGVVVSVPVNFSYSNRFIQTPTFRRIYPNILSIKLSRELNGGSLVQQLYH